MFFSHDKELNWKTFDKDRDYFEILIESEINLRITDKNIDQFDGLLKLFYAIVQTEAQTHKPIWGKFSYLKSQLFVETITSFWYLLYMWNKSYFN